jgi:hypothetical protein
MRKQKYSKRAFLNTDKTKPAYIIATVSDDTWTSHGKETITYDEVDGRLTIADCYKQVSLDFSICDPKSKQQSLKKARLFQQAVNEFVAALETEAAKKDFVRKKKKNAKESSINIEVAD